MVGEDFEVEGVKKEEPEKKLPDVIPESTKDFAQRACDAASCVDSEANIVSIMIHCCVQSILQREMLRLSRDMVAYRNVLSKKKRETPEEGLDLQATFNLERLSEGFEAGWESFKHGCGDDAAFKEFMTSMNIVPSEANTIQDEMDTTQLNTV